MTGRDHDEDLWQEFDRIQSLPPSEMSRRRQVKQDNGSARPHHGHGLSGG